MGLIAGLMRKLEEAKREKRLALARSWPTVTAKVNLIHVVAADEAVSTAARPHQVEATFSFVMNGEYYGGYVRSVGMTHHQAETLAKGEPEVVARYDPANPDVTAVLAEDNAGRLPFEVVSG